MKRHLSLRDASPRTTPARPRPPPHTHTRRHLGEEAADAKLREVLPDRPPRARDDRAAEDPRARRAARVVRAVRVVREHRAVRVVGAAWPARREVGAPPDERLRPPPRARARRRRGRRARDNTMPSSADGQWRARSNSFDRPDGLREQSIYIYYIYIYGFYLSARRRLPGERARGMPRDWAW